MNDEPFGPGRTVLGGCWPALTKDTLLAQGENVDALPRRGLIRGKNLLSNE